MNKIKRIYLSLLFFSIFICHCFCDVSVSSVNPVLYIQLPNHYFQFGFTDSKNYDLSKPDTNEISGTTIKITLESLSADALLDSFNYYAYAGPFYVYWRITTRIPIRVKIEAPNLGMKSGDDYLRFVTPTRYSNLETDCVFISGGENLVEDFEKGSHNGISSPYYAFINLKGVKEKSEYTADLTLFIEAI